MSRIYAFFEGRSMTFAWVSLAAAIIAMMLDHLTPAFAAVITALGLYVVGRSIAQDHCDPPPK